MIFIIAVSIKLSAQVNNATSLIELKAIKDTTLYGEFDYKNRRYVWNNKKDWDLTDDFIKKPRKQQTNSLLEFLSSIDSLHILNYDNDTINLFQYNGMESNPDKLEEAYRMGKKHAFERLPELRAFLKE